MDVFDAAEFLESEEEIVAYLNQAAADDDPRTFLKALRTAARAYGMVEVAKKAGMPRESLYRALSANGNPSYTTLRKIAGALGLTLGLAKAEPADVV